MFYYREIKDATAFWTSSARLPADRFIEITEEEYIALTTPPEEEAEEI